jgi:hypothetical protein
MIFVRLACVAALFCSVMPLTSCSTAQGLVQAARTTVQRAPSSLQATANRTVQTINRTTTGYSTGSY